MSAPSSTLQELPLFPLNTVLFPGGVLPLQIFEVRYLDMIARCHREGEPFGVVGLVDGSEVRQPPQDAEHPSPPQSFHPVGTLAKIESLQRPQAGLMIVQCVGTQRFRIRHSDQRRFGLWVADAELMAEDAAAPVPEDLSYARDLLQDLARNIEHSIRNSGESGVELPLRRPYQWDDCGWLANRWCEMLPLTLEVRHRLMALDSPVLRLELVADTLVQLGFASSR